MRILKYLSFAACCLVATAAPAFPQSAEGALRGTVTLAATGDPLHKATVMVVQLRRSTETNEQGQFEFSSLPPGTYDVTAHTAALTDERKSVTIAAGQVATVEFSLRLATVREQVTVTAVGREESTFESFQSSGVVTSLQLVQQAHTSIGDVLEGETGVSKRSFGAGNTRPVLRGFDGDRVLVMQDGLATGSLSSQSGDHGESINVLNLEQVEVVRGPATLLYGSNAIGGVVNAITGHHQIHEHAHEGWSGHGSAVGGIANAMAGGGFGLDYGWKQWTLRFGGGGNRTGDYDTPIGEIANSGTRSADGRAGFGWYNHSKYVSFGYDYDNRRFGVPFAAFLASGGATTPADEQTNLRPTRHDLKLNFGFRERPGAIESARASLGFTRYRHGEFDGDDLETEFFNRQLNYRITFDQRRRGGWGGSFGFSGVYRDYEIQGDELLAPPVVQNAFALFTLQTIDLKHVSFQFGGRFEHTGYNPGALPMTAAPAERAFNGFSGAAGIRVPLWEGGAFVANYTHSFRAPALEELYNNGPHVGNLAFEIGNPALEREQGDGLDLSLRHQSNRLRAEANFFYYRIRDFVFLTPTGNINSGLIEAEYLQGDTRYLGGEASLAVQVYRDIWLNAGLDAVNAQLTSPIVSSATMLVTPAGSPLPRIPPFGGHVGLEIRVKDFSFRPEVEMKHSQDDVFSTETRTPGYTVVNFTATYTRATQHSLQVFSVTAFNLGDRLYRNHLSLIKDLAPEIGIGVRFGYTVRFF